MRIRCQTNNFTLD